jgi:hypothetical protein
LTSSKDDVRRLGIMSGRVPVQPEVELGTADGIVRYLQGTAVHLLNGYIGPQTASELSSIGTAAKGAAELRIADKLSELEHRLLAVRMAKGVIDVKGRVAR